MGNAQIVRRISLDNLRYWVWVAQVFGPANHRFWDLTKEYNEIEAIYLALKNGEIKGLYDKEIKAIKTTHIEQSDKIIEYCHKNDMKIISFEDDNFPARLREIYNPPMILFCYGDLSYIDDDVVVGVVGAREPSDYGIKVAENICNELSKVGTVLVSGFAYGIDSIAHKCALRNSRTVAVLGCGLDYDYPAENAKLKKVLAKNGAVISEYFPGTKPFQEYFRQRNRLISGLSLGVLVVEASSKSGSLNTASHALSQGKDIFCIPPHDIFNEKFSGVVGLLRDGAIPVFSHLDILYEYFDNFSHKSNDSKGFENILIKNTETPEIKEPKQKRTRTVSKVKVAQAKQKVEDTNTPDFSQIYGTKLRITELLADRTLLADEISQALDMDVSKVLSELTELELDGYIKALAGKRYSL